MSRAIVSFLPYSFRRGVPLRKYDSR